MEWPPKSGRHSLNLTKQRGSAFRKPASVILAGQAVFLDRLIDAFGDEDLSLKE
jgi:hypothetical protein